MLLDRIEGEPDDKVAWGSDIAAQMLRRFGIRYVSLNPGASYRGLHDSLINHLGNAQPGMLLCLHEDHAVAVAHGYAKASGEPMACVLHSNVGLMHGMMGLFNAWCDRVPMIVLGATGPVDSHKRRPWIDWIHTSRDQGALVRSFVKWDDPPSAPVYICLDAGFQESRLEQEPEWPDLARFMPPEPPRPAPSDIERAVRLLQDAKRPLILFGRGARTTEAWDRRIALAERLGACVLSDLKTGAMFPTDHPAHLYAPFNVLPKPARELACEADVILALDWVDLAGALRQARSVGTVDAKIISATLDHNLHNGANMDHQGLPTVDVFMAAPGDIVVDDLNNALGAGHKAPWRVRQPIKPKAVEGDAISMEQIAMTLRAAFNDAEKVSFATLGRGWPIDLWPLHDPLSYLGKDGGGGIGSGPGITVGAALALHERDRYPIAMLGDGDFMMGVHALWTAVRHRIPLLILINNNRSYFNDELHQETVARTRGREPANRWIGQRLADPEPDIAKLAEAQGAVGIGPVRKAADVAAAIEKGVAVLKQGGVCVIDFHITPGEERQSGHALGHRPTTD
jgi:thiamine pyrophosphate-dependent acetolactate synthase large subunit-like protein